jgi:5'-3' exonuclease
VKVHLIDGTFELFRCFHGAPRHQLDDGREVGAIRGFLATLVSLLRKPDTTHVAIAFDAGIVGAPTRMPGGAEDSATALLQTQYHLAEAVVRALDLTMWPMVKRLQADDALATAAARFKDAPGVEQVVVCTTDKDLAQCVEGTRVVLLDRIRDRVTDEAGVRERFGLPPAKVPDYFALVGDPSDGLPGIPGWGPKSAAAVLSRYDTVEAIPIDPADWDVEVRGAARLAGNLAARRREAILYRDLSILRTDVPLRESVEDLEWRGADRGALTSLAGLLDSEEVLPRVTRWSSGRVSGSAGAGGGR